MWLLLLNRCLNNCWILRIDILNTIILNEPSFCEKYICADNPKTSAERLWNLQSTAEMHVIREEYIDYLS